MTDKLRFGRFGEITPDTIDAAGLTPDERARAFDIMEVQQAYLSLLKALKYPAGPDGIVHSLAAIEPTRLAIAYTLALCGFRRTGISYTPGKGWAAAPDPGRLPPEGWHTQPTVTVEHIGRENTS